MDNTTQDLSSIIKVNIEESEIIATIVIVDLVEENLSFDEVKAYLEGKNVAYGIDEELLREICTNPNEFLGRKLVIAKGYEPIHGEDAYIEWEINNESDNKPTERKDGTVDYYSVNKIVNMKKGQIIAKKVPIVEGKSGMSVRGKEIPPRRGKDILLKQGKNVVLNETKDKIYAAIDGQFVITEQNKINVFPIYEVNGDVDFGIGNVDFVGTVVIRGNVPDGFKIHAAGDIKVYGNVEGAELIAGGDIFIQQGVIGHNKSLIKANNNFHSAFILDGDVEAKENIYVTQSIMHSKVSAGQNVVCKGIKGIIVGSRVQAGESVEATTIGNQLATLTIVEVGINPELRMELAQIQKRKLELTKSLDKVSKGLELLNRIQQSGGNLPPEKKRLQLNLMNQQLIIEKEVKNIQSREKEIEELLSNFDNTKIVVNKAVYPGVRFVIGRAVKNINTETKYMKFVLDDGEVVAKHI